MKEKKKIDEKRRERKKKFRENESRSRVGSPKLDPGGAGSLRSIRKLGVNTSPRYSSRTIYSAIRVCLCDIQPSAHHSCTV